MIHTLPNNYIAVVKPSGFSYDYIGNSLWMGPNGMDGDGDEEIKLPSGQWQLIGLADAIGETQAGEIVEEGNNQVLEIGVACFYNNYTSSTWEDDYSTALESFKSLMESLSLDPSKTIILKKLYPLLSRTHAG